MKYLTPFILSVTATILLELEIKEQSIVFGLLLLSYLAGQYFEELRAKPCKG